MDFLHPFAIIPTRSFAVLRNRTAYYVAAIAAVVSLSESVLLAQPKLPTVDEALAISQKTGRPIFAMAGRET